MGGGREELLKPRVKLTLEACLRLRVQKKVQAASGENGPAAARVRRLVSSEAAEHRRAVTERSAMQPVAAQAHFPLPVETILKQARDRQGAVEAQQHQLAAVRGCSRLP